MTEVDDFYAFVAEFNEAHTKVTQLSLKCRQAGEAFEKDIWFWWVPKYGTFAKYKAAYREYITYYENVFFPLVGRINHYAVATAALTTKVES